MRSMLAEVVRFLVRSRTGRWCAIVGTTVLFGLFDFVVSSWCIRTRLVPELHSALHAGIAGLGAGFAVLLLLIGATERRRMVEDQMRRVAELNLSVRNSLELIVLVHHEATEDAEHKKMVLDCTEQIDRTLRELFPVIAAAKIGNGSAKKKRPGRSRNRLDRAS